MVQNNPELMRMAEQMMQDPQALQQMFGNMPGYPNLSPTSLLISHILSSRIISSLTLSEAWADSQVSLHLVRVVRVPPLTNNLLMRSFSGKISARTISSHSLSFPLVFWFQYRNEKNAYYSNVFIVTEFWMHLSPLIQPRMSSKHVPPSI